jgi:hypothetical protein
MSSYDIGTTAVLHIFRLLRTHRKRQRTSGIESYLTEIRWLPRCRAVYVVNLWAIVLYIHHIYIVYIYIYNNENAYIYVYSNTVLKYGIIIYCI